MFLKQLHVIKQKIPNTFVFYANQLLYTRTKYHLLSWSSLKVKGLMKHHHTHDRYLFLTAYFQN